MALWRIVCRFTQCMFMQFLLLSASIANERLENKLPILGSGKGEGLDV